MTKKKFDYFIYYDKDRFKSFRAKENILNMNLELTETNTKNNIIQKFIINKEKDSNFVKVFITTNDNKTIKLSVLNNLAGFFYKEFKDFWLQTNKMYKLIDMMYNSHIFAYEKYDIEKIKQMADVIMNILYLESKKEVSKNKKNNKKEVKFTISKNLEYTINKLKVANKMEKQNIFQKAMQWVGLSENEKKYLRSIYNSL